MANNAKVSLLGNLTRDPTTTTVGENNVCNFVIGVSTNAKNEQGEYKSNFWTKSPALRAKRKQPQLEQKNGECLKATPFFVTLLLK